MKVKVKIVREGEVLIEKVVDVTKDGDLVAAVGEATHEARLVSKGVFKFEIQVEEA